MSDSDSSVEGEAPSTSRKRVAKPELWKKTVAKKQRDSGESYISVTTKRQVDARSVGPPCSCSNKCFEKIGMDNIQDIFQNFWAIGDHTAEKRYIHSRVFNHDVKRSTVQGRDSRRCHSRTYTVMSCNTVITVCMRAFLSIHGISEKMVRSSVDKVGATGTVEEEQRGKHRPHNKTPDEKTALIEKHINQLPTVTAHYCRAKSMYRVYLPHGSSKATLYKDYVRWLQEQGKEDLKASISVYSKIFRTFNIGIEPPSSDTCNFCDGTKMDIKKAKDKGDDIEAGRLEAQMKFHIASSKAAQSILKVYYKDRNDSLVAIAMDLQQQLATPRLSTSAQFYKHKLWTFNFGIHNLKTREAFFYVWNESKGRRGSNEVASCLQHYLSNFVGDNVKNLVIFSDNCGGQNKNTNIVLFYLRLIHSGGFDNIEHYFLISGHSYLPCDRDFGFLEGKLKGLPVYTTDHYVELMRSCRDNNPFKVVEMGSTDFFNFDELQGHVTKGGFSGAGFKDSRVFIVDKDYKLGVKVKGNYGLGEPKFIKFQKGRGNTYDPTFDLSAVQLSHKYPNGVLLKPNKLRDIKFLTRYVEPKYLPFFTAFFRDQEVLSTQVGDGGRGDDSDPDDLSC